MEKIKYFIESDKGKDALTVIILILVGLGSFGLGRLSKTGEPSLRIDFKDTLDQESTLGSSNLEISEGRPADTSGNYFASSRGTKYYMTSCSAGKSIKVTNRVYFASAIEAQEAGYELASSCR